MTSNTSGEHQLSERARVLLNGPENLHVDFKRTVGALEPEDLVSFANSKSGGTILLGVDEAKDAGGKEIGLIVGCTMGDKEKLAILSKATSCIPSIELSIYQERSADKAFYRVEIPSGRNKPYCTGNGTYKIRDDGKNRPLDPTRLLNLFLETESGMFLERFESATRNLERSVASLSDTSAQIHGCLFGGDSFPIVRVIVINNDTDLQKTLQLAPTVVGSLPLRSFSLLVTKVDTVEASHFGGHGLHHVHCETFWGRPLDMRGVVAHIPLQGDYSAFWIQSSALNGSWQQFIRLRRIGQRWEWWSLVYASRPSNPEQPYNLVLEESSAEFPKSETVEPYWKVSPGDLGLT